MADYFYNPTPAPGLACTLNNLYISENNFNLIVSFYSDVLHTTVAPAADITNGWLSAQTNLALYKRIFIKNIIVQSTFTVMSTTSQYFQKLNNINLIMPSMTFSIGFHSGAFTPVNLTANNQNLYINPIFDLALNDYCLLADSFIIPVNIAHNIISNTFISVIGGFHSSFNFATDYATQYALWLNQLGISSNIFAIINALKITIQGEIY
jgi:hypothetical protein